MAENDSRQLKRIKWYRSPIDPADLARLNQRSNWRGLLHTISFLAVLVCSGGIAWYAVDKAHILIVLALIYLHGALSAFLVNGFHELCHKNRLQDASAKCPVSKYLQLSGLVQSCLILGQPSGASSLYPASARRPRGGLARRLDPAVLSCFRLHQSTRLLPCA